VFNAFRFLLRLGFRRGKRVGNRTAEEGKRARQLSSRFFQLQTRGVNGSEYSILLVIRLVKIIRFIFIYGDIHMHI
jgi:hypothetical protein